MREKLQAYLSLDCMPAWKLNKTSTREPTYFLQSTRCWDGDIPYNAKFIRPLTKLVFIAYIHKKRKKKKIYVYRLQSRETSIFKLL